MDEPTAVLTPGEVEELFKVLFKLRQENRSIIFISHKLDEVLQISNRITILRDGCNVATVPNSPDLDRRKLAQMMVGRDINFNIEKPPSEKGEVVLSLNKINLKSGTEFGLKDITLEVHRGEIYGIAGVDGNGQDELAETIMGLQKIVSGHVHILGNETTHWKTPGLRQLPLAYIPKDRHNVGLVMDMSVRDNLVLTRVNRAPFGTFWQIKMKILWDNAVDLIKRF